MGDGGVIADTSSTLRALLESEVDVSPLDVTLAAPHRVTDDSSVTLGLYLYQVTEDPHTSTVRRQDVDSTTLRKGPLSIELHYLLTAFPGGDGSDNDQAERQHKALGEAMRVLRDNAVLRGSDLHGSLDGELRVEQADDTRDVMDVWSTFPETGYLPSIAYTAGPVTITSTAEMDPGRVTTLEHRNDDA